ncbi:MAG: nucleotidyltransferase family protein [Thermoanaerobaculia bacterium]
MSRAETLARLAMLKGELARFHVLSLSVFGSVARDEASPESDVDLLVEFSEPVGLLEFVRLRRHLEVALGVRVDLATPSALRDDMRSRILAEAIRAA